MSPDDAWSLAERIDALLPQTQCRRCGHPGCRPYAEALAVGAEPINRCPPGGDATIAALAALLDRPAVPLDPAYGAAEPLHIARIEEATCIGCTLCIAACPVDAIVGARRHMHTVIAGRCTGCGLCVPACPVDCIAMLPAHREWTRGDAERARARHAAHEVRIAHDAASSKRSERADPRAVRQAAVAAALARARARRAAARAARG